ncbi:MAG: HAMP domain-containing histidine kinase [Chloroflexota bacterium]|nr:HAMP domain-containing histidine kinase [Chloroflexota bacterium]
MFFGCLFMSGVLLLASLGIASLALIVGRALGADLPAAPVSLSWAIPPLLLFVVVVGLFVVARSVRRFAAPLGDLMTATTRLADGAIDVRVERRGPREVRRLIDSFNTMAERIGHSEEQRRRLLADVGHELRTPLAVMQGQLEGALDGVYDRDDAHLGAILEETRHMSRIVEDLRILSLAESGALPLDRRPTSLQESVDDAIDGHERAAAAAGVTVTSALAADLPAVDADPTRLREILDNVLTNAIRYTPAGGSVAFGARREGPTVLVLVKDTGRGIAPEELASVFERFHRSPDSRGSGLGLAIARDLVRGHGGEMRAESDGPGLGTTIRFTLPAAAEL